MADIQKWASQWRQFNDGSIESEESSKERKDRKDNEIWNVGVPVVTAMMDGKMAALTLVC